MTILGARSPSFIDAFVGDYSNHLGSWDFLAN